VRTDGPTRVTDEQAVAGSGPAGRAGLVDRLAPYLEASVLVVNRKGRIVSGIGPPGGAVDVRASIGTHAFDHAHPDDLPRIFELALEALRTEPGWRSQWTLRLRPPGGEWSAHELLIVNRTDDPVIDGFVVRIRALAEADTTIPSLSAPDYQLELESLAGAVPVPVVFIGPTRVAHFANAAAHELCGEWTHRLEQSGLAGIAAPCDRAQVEETMSRLLAAPGEALVTFRMLPRDTDGAGAGAGAGAGVGVGAGGGRLVEARISSRGRGGRVHAVVASLVDVTARSEAETELRRRATHDPLTGVANRTELEDALRERLQRSPERVSVFYCDLDGFKAVNDTYGHEAGDALLVDIARGLQSAARPVDLVGRLGGDEFAVLVEGIEPADALKLAERLGATIAEVAWRQGRDVGASVGVAGGTGGDTPHDVLRRADAAMYAEKRRARLRRPLPA